MNYKYDDEYSKLEPGLYLQRGSSFVAIKSRSRIDYPMSWQEFARSIDNRFGQANMERLAQEVAWVYVALDRRKEQIQSIPYAWELNGEELDGVTPWDMMDVELFQQTDESMQYYSTAYWQKQRLRGKLLGLRWLDPETIEPDYKHANPRDGVTTFFQDMGEGQRRAIPAADIVWFKIPGMRELAPGTSAGDATRLAASVLRGIDETDTAFYANNALPLMLVSVPMSTPPEESDRLKRFFQRIINPQGGTKSYRVEAVREGVTVNPLSFKPADMDKTALEDSKRDAILAAHKVPQSIAMSDAANYATAIEAKRSFVETMGGRLSYIARVLNRDPDFQTAGYALMVRTQDHYAMKEDEAQRSNAFYNYYQGGFTEHAAAYLVGITVEDFPEDIQDIGVFREKQAPPQFNQPANEGPVGPEQQPSPRDDERASEEAEAEAKAYRRWCRKREHPNPADFKASYLSTEEKELILYEVKSEQAADVAIDELTAVMRQLAGGLDTSGGNDEVEDA